MGPSGPTVRPGTKLLWEPERKRRRRGSYQDLGTRKSELGKNSLRKDERITLEHSRRGIILMLCLYCVAQSEIPRSHKQYLSP